MEYMESKMQDHYEASNAWLEEFKQLKAERDALAAQVALIHDVWQSAGLSVKCNDITEARKAITSTPQQCLAEIKAEAGRAGFIAGYHKMHIEFVGSLASSEGAEFAANQHAAKVQQGEKGTWLKDSNVNGGKRQGGAE